MEIKLSSGLNTLRPRQDDRHFPDDSFKWIFLNENVWISIEVSLKFVLKGPINNIPALVQIMAWRRPGDKPLSEPMMFCLLTHICVTRPQWVNRHHRQLCHEWHWALYHITLHQCMYQWRVNTLKPIFFCRRHFQTYFLDWKCFIFLFQIHVNLLLIAELTVRVVAWCLIGDKALSEPTMATFTDANTRHSASMS